MRGIAAGAALVLSLAAGCSDDDSVDTDDEVSTTTSTVAGSPTGSTEPTATLPGGEGEDEADLGEDDATVSPPPAPGSACTLGSHPDCIDPDGDGQGTFLLEGGACMAESPSPEFCSDPDGDGHAGYPDSG